MEFIIVLVFSLAFILSWILLWNLLHDPEINFYLHHGAIAHEPDLDEKMNRIAVFLHEEEEASIDEIANVIGTTPERISECLRVMEEKKIVARSRVSPQIHYRLL